MKAKEVFLASQIARSSGIHAEDVAEWYVTRAEGDWAAWYVLMRFEDESRKVGDCPGFAAAIVSVWPLEGICMVDDVKALIASVGPVSMRCLLNRGSRMYRRVAFFKELLA